MSTTVAGWTVLQLHKGGAPASETRKSLLNGGVPKGTVSKIVAILDALRDGRLRPDQVTSVNYAYGLIKRANLRAIINGIPDLTDGELLLLIAKMNEQIERRDQS